MRSKDGFSFEVVKVFVLHINLNYKVLCLKKIRCSECGNIIAFENEPINDKGEISIMCNHRKPNGERCKTINIIKKNNENDN